jgi:hypothetical protein
MTNLMLRRFTNATSDDEIARDETPALSSENTTDCVNCQTLSVQLPVTPVTLGLDVWTQLPSLD